MLKDKEHMILLIDAETEFNKNPYPGVKKKTLKNEEKKGVSSYSLIAKKPNNPI